jgi:hypothetical protein
MNGKFHFIMPYFAVHAGFILCMKSLRPFCFGLENLFVPPSMSMPLDMSASLHIECTVYEFILLYFPVHVNLRIYNILSSVAFDISV